MKPSDVPERIPIAHDDRHASRIGRLDDGRHLARVRRGLRLLKAGDQ